MEGIIIASVAGIVLGGIVAAAVMQYIRQKEYKKIEHLLEHYMSTESIDEEDCQETRESKLVSQLTRTLRMVDHKRLEAEQEKEGVTRFLSDISHQLKTPLANIRVYTELLADESLTKEEQHEFVARIDSQSEKMQWLMKMLFQASRLETGAIKFEAEPCDVTDTIEMAIDAVRGQAADKNIKLVTMPWEACQVKHNPKWTAEAITNVLENAIKYSKEGSTVTVSFECLSIYGRINVKDEGIGIAKEEYTKIYQRFYRSKSVLNQQGSGLGLYLSQLILALQEGYISVESEKGKGSKFSLYLLLA